MLVTDRIDQHIYCAIAFIDLTFSTFDNKKFWKVLHEGFYWIDYSQIAIPYPGDHSLFVHSFMGAIWNLGE